MALVASTAAVDKKQDEKIAHVEEKEGGKAATALAATALAASSVVNALEEKEETPEKNLDEKQESMEILTAATITAEL